MEVCRLLSDEERCEIIRRLNLVEKILQSVKELIDPMGQGLDETPPVPRKDKQKCKTRWIGDRKCF